MRRHIPVLPLKTPKLLRQRHCWMHHPLRPMRLLMRQWPCCVCARSRLPLGRSVLSTVLQCALSRPQCGPMRQGEAENWKYNNNLYSLLGQILAKISIMICSLLLVCIYYLLLEQFSNIKCSDDSRSTYSIIIQACFLLNNIRFETWIMVHKNNQNNQFTLVCHYYTYRIDFTLIIPYIDVRMHERLVDVDSLVWIDHQHLRKQITSLTR